MNKALVTLLALVAAGLTSPWASGQERFAMGNATLLQGDSVMVRRKGGEKVEGVFVWSDAKAGRVFIRTKPGQAPIAVASNDIEKVERIVPASAAGDKGKVLPAVEGEDARAAAFEIQTMTVHNGPYAVIYYFDGSLSEGERKELRAMEKAAADVAERGRRVEALREALDVASQPVGPTVLPYYDALITYPYYDLMEFPGYRPRTIVNVVVLTAPVQPPDPAKIAKSLDEATAALAAAQKQYRSLASHAVYDARGHIVAVRLEE